jgi:hypothetical protein
MYYFEEFLLTKKDKIHIDNHRLFVIPFDPEILSILRKKKENFDKTVPNKRTLFKRNIEIENLILFQILCDKKAKISSKFQVQIFADKNSQEQLIRIESKNEEYVENCCQYILTVKENAKIEHYDSVKYGSLIKSKFEAIKNSFESKKSIIELYIPNNDQNSIFLFATTTANDAKKFVKTFFKSFEFIILNRNFDEESYNLIKEKIKEIEDQASIKIIVSNNIGRFEFIGERKNIEIADQIIKNILSNSLLESKSLGKQLVLKFSNNLDRVNIKNIFLIGVVIWNQHIKMIKIHKS